VEQSLCELEAEEVEMAKMGSIPTAVELVYILVVESLSLIAYLLPLANLFFFNSFFYNCLTCFFIILLNLFYCIFKILFWFSGSFFVSYPLNLIP